ncbi:MAG TPA: hypothetical protein VM511_12215, partial [Luteolibacter sp.]|nr:hypothetical protein [Luteolibacter sp.]
MAPASILMIDFGPTAATGGNLTNSPYHVLNPGFAESSWNQVQTTDVASGLVMSDGSVTGIGVNLGVANEGGVGGTLVDLGVTPTGNSALGTVVNTGIYATTSVATDGIFSATGTAVRHIGVQITGLAAGVYEVFVATRNTNTSAAYTMTTYAGAGTAGSNFNFITDPGYVSGALSHAGGNVAGTPTVASWNVEGTTGENYNRLTVTIAAGQALNIAVQGDGTQTRGFLNMIQVVAVPEPSTALLALGSLLPL